MQKFNGLSRYLPISQHHGDIKVYRSGQWIVLHTTLGLTVWWNRAGAIIKVPGSCADRMSGMCGNCNGYADDDFTGKEGKDHGDLSEEQTGAAMANSFIVQGNGYAMYVHYVHYSCVCTIHIAYSNSITWSFQRDFRLIT